MGCIKSEKEIKHAVVVVMKTICDIKCWFVGKEIVDGKKVFSRCIFIKLIVLDVGSNLF